MLVLASDPSGLVWILLSGLGLVAGIVGFTSMLFALEGPGKRALAKAFCFRAAVGLATFVVLWLGLAALMSL